jgi:transposase
MVKRQKFTSEFELEALRLMESSGKPAADLARELGVRRNQLYKWKDQLDKRGTQAFRGPGKRPKNSD